MDITYLYTPLDTHLTKAIETDAATGVPKALLVTGKVTGAGVDTDDQIVDPAWAREALGVWLERYGNIRVMHSKDPSALAGVAVKLAPAADGDGLDLTSRITDPATIDKVLDGRLKGYSIGIGYPTLYRDAQAKRGRIRGKHVGEVSLVDAPAYPPARLHTMQAIYKLADSGQLEALDPAELDEAEPIEKAAIAHKEGEPKSPPKGYPTDKSQYADPQNYSWPIDKPSRIRSAMAYYNAGKGKNTYSDEEWATIGRKIAAAANTAFGAGHSLKNGQITHDDAEKGVTSEALVAGLFPTLVDAEGRAFVDLPARYLGKDADTAAVIPEIGYEPFPLDAPHGFGPPPEVTEGPFTDPPAEGGAGSVTEAARPSHADDGQFKAISDDQPVFQQLDPTGRTFPDITKLTESLTKAIESVPTLEKNGVARALGPSATTLLYQMLANEVAEDGGSGSEADDIKEIACAYHGLQCFICEELAEEGDLGAMAKGADDGRYADALAAVQAALTHFAPEATKGLVSQDASCGCCANCTGPGCGCCDQCQPMTENPYAREDETVTAEKVVTIDDIAYTLDTLAAAYQAAQARAETLQKQLDVTPKPGGPMRFALAAEAQAPQATPLDERIAALRAQRTATNDPGLIQYYNDEIIKLRASAPAGGPD